MRLRGASAWRPSVSINEHGSSETPIHLQVLIGNHVRIEAGLRKTASTFLGFSLSGWVFQGGTEGESQVIRGESGGDEASTLCQQLGQSTRRCRYHGPANGHGLGRCVAERLLPQAWNTCDRCARVELDDSIDAFGTYELDSIGDALNFAPALLVRVVPCLLP